MSIKDRIIQKLTEQLKPVYLEVIDDSNSHAGHAGYRTGGETHFNVIVVSSNFFNKNKVARHKMAYAILEQEMKERVHALSVKAYTPEEWEAVDRVQ